jgi:hypothetical protein
MLSKLCRLAVTLLYKFSFYITGCRNKPYCPLLGTCHPSAERREEQHSIMIPKPSAQEDHLPPDSHSTARAMKHASPTQSCTKEGPWREVPVERGSEYFEQVSKSTIAHVCDPYAYCSKPTSILMPILYTRVNTHTHTHTHTHIHRSWAQPNDSFPHSREP